MKLKLDLHTHVFEEFLPGSPKAITIRSVERIIEQIKLAGLDGIAITEHYNIAYGYAVKEIIETKFHNEVLIIPGSESENGPFHFVELELPGKETAIFRFVAHPGYPGNPPALLAGFHGIEIENGGHNWHIDRDRVRDLAAKNGLMLLHNSDAHYLRDVGRFYNEVSLEDLHKLAVSHGAAGL